MIAPWQYNKDKRKAFTGGYGIHHCYSPYLFISIEKKKGQGKADSSMEWGKCFEICK